MKFLDMSAQELASLEWSLDNVFELVQIGIFDVEEIEENFSAGLRDIIDHNFEDEELEFAKDYFELSRYDREDLAVEEMTAREFSYYVQEWLDFIIENDFISAEDHAFLKKEIAKQIINRPLKNIYND